MEKPADKGIRSTKVSIGIKSVFSMISLEETGY